MLPAETSFFASRTKLNATSYRQLRLNDLGYGSFGLLYFAMRFRENRRQNRLRSRSWFLSMSRKHYRENDRCH